MIRVLSASLLLALFLTPASAAPIAPDPSISLLERTQGQSCWRLRNSCIRDCNRRYSPWDVGKCHADCELKMSWCVRGQGFEGQGRWDYGRRYRRGIDPEPWGDRPYPRRPGIDEPRWRY